AGHDGLPFLVPLQERHDISNAEHIGIHDDRAACITHELGRHEAQDRKGLEIVVSPLALQTATQIGPPFVSVTKPIVAGMDGLYIAVSLGGGEALEGRFREQRPGFFGVSQSNSQRRHACRRIGSRNSASVQVWPPSVLTATSVTSVSPAHVVPAIV